MTTSLVGFWIRPISMALLRLSAVLKASSRTLEPQQLHGLEKQVGLIIVVITLSLMHLCLVFGKFYPTDFRYPFSLVPRFLWFSWEKLIMIFISSQWVCLLLNFPEIWIGIWTNLQWQRLTIPKHTADRHWLAGATVYSTPAHFNQTRTTTGPH